MASKIVTSGASAIADRIGHNAVTLDGVVAFLEDQVQSENLLSSRLAFTLAEATKTCIFELEMDAKTVRAFVGAEESTEREAEGPNALAGWDSSIYLAWVRAMSDMMLTGGDVSCMDKHTLSTYGGLMHALTKAAEEMQERERAEMREEA